MLVGYVRISTADDRQSTDLQRDAMLSAGVDERNIHEDKVPRQFFQLSSLNRCQNWRGHPRWMAPRRVSDFFYYLLWPPDPLWVPSFKTKP
jgi:hypothetical protein